MDLDKDMHESPALSNLLDSQNNADVKLKKKNNKKKRKKTKYNAVKSDVNACGTPENTCSSKTSTFGLDICLGENEKKDKNIISEAAEKGNGESGIQDKGCNINSVVANAELFAKESVSEDVKLKKKNNKRKRKTTKCNAVKSDVNACGIPENTCSSKTSTFGLDICLGENEKKDKSIISEAAEKGNGESGIQDNGCNINSVVANAELFAKESVSEDVKLKKKNNKRKRKTTKCNAVKSDVNACGIPENTCSSKTSTFGLDICLGENEKKDKNIISEAAEKGNGESGIQDKGCNFNSVVANAELFAKESVSEVVKMNIEQSITASSSIPEETSDSVKNGRLVKNHDEDLEVHDLSDKSRCIKTYSRKKLNNNSCEGNLNCSSPVNCNKEPTIQDHHNDNSLEVSDGPLTDGLMEIETEHLIGQNKVEAEEIELIAENNSEQKTTTSSSVVDILVTQIEETNARQVDRADVTRNDMCCPGDVSEQKTTTTSSVVDIPVAQLEETNASQVDHAEVTRNDTCCPGDVSDLSLVAVNGGNSKISQCSVDRTIISNSKKKLLILDVNGLLADCVSDVPNGYYQPEPDFWVRRRKVYKRPFCDGFLQFCFDKFHVGVWSSRAKCNVDEVIKCLMGKSASRLLFCWNQSHCTTTKFSTVENKDKPLVLKELRKLWEKLEPSLPWEKGEFNESNTLLLDDSPYKALVNPKYTAIFPYSYRYYHTRDSALGPKGDLRAYLERLAMADNVQEFVESNPFGQRPIREANPSWGYYLKVIESVKCRENDRPSASDKEQIA